MSKYINEMIINCIKKGKLTESDLTKAKNKKFISSDDETAIKDKVKGKVK